MNYITLIIGIAIGLACFWISIRLIRLFLTVRKWNRVEARVLAREIFLRPKYSYSRTPYGINLEYEFSLNGQRYTGHKMNLAELMGGQVNYMKKTAERKVNKIETTMLIYVNPNNPNESVLYCHGIVFYVVIFLMGILSILMGLSSIVTH